MMFKKVWPTIFRAMHSLHLWESSLWRFMRHRIMGLMFLGVISRLLPHPPNFTAMNAIALFGIYSLGSLGSSVFTVYSAMLLCDLVFGLHSTMSFVYFSYGLIILMGYALKSKRSLIRTSCLLALSSLVFFMITNFGVWLVGSMYPKTMAGLGLCYLAAIPFFANNLTGTLLYGGLLFGWCVLAERETPRIIDAA